jgi:O-antigen ligase
MKEWMGPSRVLPDGAGGSLLECRRATLAPLILTGIISLALGMLFLSDPGISFGLVVAAVVACTLQSCTRIFRTLVLWWLLLSYRAFLPRLDQIDLKAQALTDLSLLLEIGILGFIGAFVVGDILPSALFVRNARWTRLIKLCMAFAGGAVLSSLIGPRPLFALASAGKLVCAVGLSAYAVAAAKDISDIRRFLGVTYLGLLPYMLLPWVALLIAPEFAYAPNGRLIGFWVYPVVLGIIASMISIASMVRFTQGGSRLRRYTFAAISLLGIVTCLATASKSGFGAYLVGLIAVAVLGLGVPTQRRRVAILLVLGGIVLGCAFDMIAVDYLESWYLSGTEVGTLSGRTQLWSGVIQQVLEDPLRALIGHGYTAARVEGFVVRDLLWYSTEAHNALLNVLYEMGILGLGLLVAIIVIALWSGVKAVRGSREQLERMTFGEALAMMCVVLVASLAVSLYGGMPRAEGLVFWSLVMVLGWPGKAAQVAER